MHTAAAAMPSVDSGLSRYLDEIKKFPLLSPEEEQEFAKRWRAHRDRDAAYRLVTSHLRLVAKIAMRFRGYGLPIADIVSEGNIGLMQAVRRFDPDRGVRLATYAMWWIKACIQDYVLRSWSLVRIAASDAQKKLFFKLRRAKSKISAFQDGDLRPDQVAWIAERLQVSEREVVEMNNRLRPDVPLVPASDENEGGPSLESLVDLSPDQEFELANNQETDLRRRALHDALAELTPRERRIFIARRLVERPPTLEQLGTEYGISRERARQVEERAFQKVQAAMKATNALPRKIDKTGK